MHRFTDTDTLKYYIIIVTLQGHLRSKVIVPNERSYACSYPMNNCNYMSIRNHFKDIATFLSKKFMPSQVNRNVLDDPKSSEIFCA